MCVQNGHYMIQYILYMQLCDILCRYLKRRWTALARYLNFFWLTVAVLTNNNKLEAFLQLVAVHNNIY